MTTAPAAIGQTQAKTDVSFIQLGVRLIGRIYLALGLIGFLPIEAINPLHAEGVGAHYLFNLIAINWLHNIVHLVIGLTASWAAGDLRDAQRWGKLGGTVLMVLFVAGMVQAYQEGFPKDQLLLGLIPLNSPGHVLHLTSGLVALYLGFIHPVGAATPAPSRDAASNKNP